MTDKERLDAQERALQIIGNYLSNSGPFEDHVTNQLRKWHEASQSNTTTSEEDKAKTAAQHDEIDRILLPRKTNTL